MLTCQGLTEIVTDYLEGRLPPMKWLGFQMHIGMCRNCRTYLRQMKVTVAAVGRMPPEPIPPAIKEELPRRLKDMGSP